MRNRLNMAILVTLATVMQATAFVLVQPADSRGGGYHGGGYGSGYGGGFGGGYPAYYGAAYNNYGYRGYGPYPYYGRDVGVGAAVGGLVGGLLGSVHGHGYE